MASILTGCAPRVSKSEHVARQTLADLFLDTFPYTAHSSARDALRAGLPLITCPGRALHSRIAGSHLAAAGLSDLIVASFDDYVELAVKLAHNRDRLNSYRQHLADNRATIPVFDTATYVRHLEVAFRKMITDYDSGAQPQSFRVSDLG